MVWGGDQQTIDNSVKSELWMIRFVHILMFYLKWSRFFFFVLLVQAYYEKPIKIKNWAMQFQILRNSYFQKGNTKLKHL